MKLIEVVDVDEALVDDVWKHVEGVSGFYSIGDGCSKAILRQVLFQSSYVFRLKDGFIRLDRIEEGFELHPIVLGMGIIRGAREILDSIAALFPKSNICCIIPSEMRAAKRLAERAGMVEIGPYTRNLSGVPLPCVAYIRRCENVA